MMLIYETNGGLFVIPFDQLLLVNVSSLGVLFCSEGDLEWPHRSTKLAFCGFAVAPRLEDGKKRSGRLGAPNAYQTVCRFVVTFVSAASRAR